MCTANTKTKASNGIRDGIMKTFQQNLPIAKLIESATQVESEEYNIVKSLSTEMSETRIRAVTSI
jgi:hypothetical protein